MSTHETTHNGSKGREAKAHAAASEQPQPNELGTRPNVEATQNVAPGARVANGLGWFSVGLGLTQILAPRAIDRMIGIKNGSRTAMRLLGVRDLVSGLGLLGARRTALWTSARVAGDVMDLGLLALALTRSKNNQGRLAAATAAVLGVAATDAWATRKLFGDTKRQEQVPDVTNVVNSITINASAEALYTFWRDPHNMPLIMENVRSVEPLEGPRSRWTGFAPDGTAVQWEAEIVEDMPGELLAWRTLEGPFECSGSVRFLTAPGGRGTEVVVDTHYRLRGGVAGKLIALAARRDPGVLIGRALHRLKQIIEIGEVMRSDASIHCGAHAARPPSPSELRDLPRASAQKGGV